MWVCSASWLWWGLCVHRCVKTESTGDFTVCKSYINFFCGKRSPIPRQPPDPTGMSACWVVLQGYGVPCRPHTSLAALCEKRPLSPGGQVTRRGHACGDRHCPVWEGPRRHPPGSGRAGSYLRGGPPPQVAAESVLGCTHPCVPISILRIPHRLVLCHWTGRSQPTLLSLGACALSSPNTCVVTPALRSPPARLLPIVTRETLNNGVSRAFLSRPCPIQQPERGRLSYSPSAPHALRPSCASGSSRERTLGGLPRGCPWGNGCEREGGKEPWAETARDEPAPDPEGAEGKARARPECGHRGAEHGLRGAEAGVSGRGGCPRRTCPASPSAASGPTG